MATTTTNFGWDIPQSTDLVKDGATAIAALGQDIDTSMVDLKGGTTGQILSKTSNTDMDFTWINNDQGDITGVTAGTGLTGGGTSGSVTLNFDIANYGGGQYAAGKNKILNGDFSINQRAFTSTTSDAVFTFDRYKTATTGGTSTFTSQTFTPGAAPVAGYEAKNYLQLDSTGQSAAGDRTFIRNLMESARLLAGQTYTVSFWAKASSGTPSIALEPFVSFGTGGSPSASLDGSTLGNYKTALTTSWVRYSATFTMPSVSGKTFGTNNDDSTSMIFWTSAGSTYNSRTNSLGIQTTTIQIWGIQVELGSQATPFQTATGNPASELAACQRYYYRQSATDGANFYYYGFGSASSTTNGKILIQFPVTMRVKPSAVDYSTVGLYDGATNTTVTAVTQSIPTTTNSQVDATVASGLTQFRPYFLFTQNNAAGYIGFSAEL